MTRRGKSQRSPISVKRPGSFWQRWLVAVDAGVMLFGISMMLTPGLIRQFFSLLIYSSTQTVDTFGQPAVAYISLMQGVLGAVMFGWGVALMIVITGPFRRGNQESWQLLAVSVAAWFIPDTLFSLWTGFWQNAVLNLVFGLLFALPLAMTYRELYRAEKPSQTRITD